MGEMRRAGARLAVAAALACALLTRPAWADTPGAVLALSPGQGAPSSAVSMTFDYSALLLCPVNLPVTFTWDGTARTLAQTTLDGAGCSASASVPPPADLDTPGPHTVVATAGSQNASATYTVLAVSPGPTATTPARRTPTPTPARTPTPHRTPTPSPTPTPTPVPTPTQPPTPTPVCDTRVPQATGQSGYLQVAGVRGDASEPQHAGAIVIQAMSPASMLPPAVGTVSLTEVSLTKAVDASTPALVQAVASGVHFDCVQLEMGPSRQFLYATYAFHDVLFSSYTPTGGAERATERLTLNYGTVQWEYQLRDGSPVHTGTGRLGDTPDPRPLGQPAFPAIPFTLLGVLLLGAAAGGGLLWYRGWRNQEGVSRHQ